MVLIGGLAYCGLTLAAGAAVFPFGRYDLMPLAPWPGARIAELARPLDSIRDVAVRDAFAEIQRRTRPDESILVYPAPCQYYFFAGRRMSGLYFGYLRSTMEGTSWEERNREAICNDMPRVVMVMNNFLAMPAGAGGLPVAYGSDHIDALLREPCWTKVFDREGVILLQRSAGPEPATLAARTGTADRR